MYDTFIIDRSTPFRRLLTTNSTSATDPTKTDTLTAPAADYSLTAGTNGVLNVGESDFVPKRLVLCPFGAGADGNTFTIYVFGWERVISAGSTVQYHPVHLFQAAVTMSGTIKGVAGGVVVASDLYADTIADPTVGTLGTTCYKISPANDNGAMISVNIEGYRIVEIVTKIGTATSANTLYKVV